MHMWTVNYVPGKKILEKTPQIKKSTEIYLSFCLKGQVKP